MRTGTPEELLTGWAGYWPVIQSWRGGHLLAEQVPVTSGRATASVTQEVPERLTLRVPRWDGRDWLPGKDHEHPLARYGQELAVSVMLWSAVTGAEYQTRIGRYLITEWDYDDGGELVVAAEGLLRRVADDRLPAPSAPRAGATLISEARRLMPPGMAAGFDQRLEDRNCPTSMEWAEDRLGALYEIADAWPARLRTDAWGQAQFRPALPDVATPVATLKDGERGTVVGVARTDGRGAPNRVVARSSASGVEVQAIAEQTTGPMATSGPYGTVTEFFSSPLLRNRSAAQAAANTRLRSRLLPTRTVPVTCVPDPRLDLDDAVEVIRDGVRDWGFVVGYDLPLTVADGAMRLDVGVPA
ncbi:hypothetical protein [Actinotalea sp. JY-7876]|uniref:hypothetical protein n=1 Tax=Actinotalea sp. JY-7876 TaxID=2758442 RepID=UPI0015F77A87|nr:hypothetical protein [Actinotalea sp. JY-7876]